MALPHRYPFRLIDRWRPDRAVFGVTVAGYWNRGAEPLSPAWIAEAMAQAAAVLLEPPAGESGSLVLAGLEGVTLEVPILPGAAIEIEVALGPRLGGLVRVEAVARLEGRQVARGNLTLSAR